MSETTTKYNAEHTEYEYQNKELSTAAAKAIILERYRDGKAFHRQEAVAYIESEHVSRGGLPNKITTTSLNSAKSALAKLCDAGIAENPALGYWRIIKENGDQSKYKYRDIPLSRPIAKELLLEMFSDETFTKQDATDLIVSGHNERGGVPCDGEKAASSVMKEALRELKEEGMVAVVSPSKRGPGVQWHIFSDGDPNLMEGDDDTEGVEDLGEGVVPTDPEPHKTIGTGDQSVYVYYYPAYKELAELKGMDTYRCKVGKFNNDDPLSRVWKQLGTSTCEYPQVALVINTDNPEKMEKALHIMLDLMGRHLTDTPGNEWFLTNPEEVEAIYKSLMDIKEKTP